MSELTDSLRAHGQRHMGTDLGGLLRKTKRWPSFEKSTPAKKVIGWGWKAQWAHNENYGFWESACGEAWRFDDGGPAENSMHFCHSCGKSLRIKGKEAGNADA